MRAIKKIENQALSNEPRLTAKQGIYEWIANLKIHIGVEILLFFCGP